MKFQPQAAAADLDLMATCSKSAIIVDVRAGSVGRQAGRQGVSRGGSVWSRVQHTIEWLYLGRNAKLCVLHMS